MPAVMENRDSARLEEIKTVLRALLISNGQLDVTVHRLNAIYREQEEEDIPFREFGYRNLQEFLHSIPDVVYLQYNREHQLCVHHIAVEESAHISSLIARQRKPQKKPKYNVKPRNFYSNYYNNSRPPPRPQYMQPRTMSTLNSLRLVLEELRKTPRDLQHHNGIRKSDILQKLMERPGKSSITDIQTLNVKLKELSHILVVDSDFVYFKDDVFKSGMNATSDTTQKAARYEYRNLHVRSAPRQNVMPTFEANQQVSGCKPVFNQPTSLSIQDKRPLPTETSQSQMSSPVNHSQKVPLTDVKQAQKSSGMSSGNEVINERLKFRLEKLVKKYPEGIWAAELPNLYWKEYNLELGYHDLGFTSITEFISAVPEIFTITDPDDTGRYMILDAKIPVSKDEHPQQTQTQGALYNYDDYTTTKQEPVPHKLSSTVIQKFIPDGMMGLNETVDHISVSTLAGEDYFEVNISEIFTPSFFWITLRENKSKIKKLMDELAAFYKKQNLDACRLPQVLLEVGLNVACVYATMWHRAIIKKVKPDGYVVVLFYDYGTVKTYNPNHLYYLHKRFAVLPAQALACGLYNVKTPQGNEWPILSTNKFVKKVWDVPLIATVCETNDNNNTMMITLTDTSESSFDLHLNEWMIGEGLAVRGKMVCIADNFAFHHYKKCLAKKDCDLSNDKCRKKHFNTLDEKTSEESNVFINNHVDYHAKMAAIEKYKKLYCTSSESSSNDEIVVVYKDVNKDNVSHYDGSLLVNRFKQLKKENSNYSNISQSNLKQDNRKLSDDEKVEIMRSRIMSLKFPNTKQNINVMNENLISNNIFDDDSFYGINGGHGRMEPIDWTIISEK